MMISLKVKEEIQDLEALDDDDLQKIKQEIEQEQAEGAIQDLLKHWHNVHLPTSIELKGMYDSLMTVGFDSNQAFILTLTQLQKSK